MAALRTNLTLLEDSVAKYGALPVFKLPTTDSEGGRTWKTVTYTQFAQDIETHARYWAHELSKRGIRAQSVVGIWLGGTSYQDVLTIWAICRAGHVPQLFTGRMTNSTVVFELLNRGKAVALIADPAFYSVTTHTPLPILRPGAISSSSQEPLPDPSPVSDPNHVLFYFHTSGSTSGSPKLVPVTAKWFESSLAKLRHFINDSTAKQQIVTSVGSFGHIANNLVFWSFLNRGGCMIMPEELLSTASDVRQMANEQGLSALNLFASFLSKIFDAAREDESLLTTLKGFEHVICSGMALHTEQEEWAVAKGINLVNVFASTEIGAMLQSVEGLSPSTLAPFPGTAYKFVPLPGGKVAGKELKELVVTPESQDCPHSSFLDPETGDFHTGDLFIEAEAGRYISVGRNDDWIKMMSAARCDAGSIERNAMATCGKGLIDAVIVVGTGRRCPVVIVEPKDSTVPERDPTSLKAEIWQKIAPFHKRRLRHERIDAATFILVAPRGSLPRTPKGNIRRKATDEQYKTEMDAIFAAN